ncbi:MAG TPA: D-glycerate dehydrogenase [Negativicutes bacterium]|nr:D-glycerate dehydrogenase [Negativicutes bacterium]
MAKQKVFVTRQIPEASMTELKEQFDVTVNPDDRVLSKAELLAGVKGMDAVLCLLTDTIDAEVFDAAGPQCRIFSNYAVGYNNVDVAAATERGIIVTNTPDVLNDATADLAWTLLFAVSRRIVEADRYARAGKFKGWGPLLLLGRDITGKKLGIIGAGRIGCNLARKAKGFDMELLYSDTKPNARMEELGARFVDKETLLREADFISVHVPLTPETKHYIAEKEFRLMKKEAVIVNTSRGPVVDEKALVKALAEGWIWGAGLDVFENEPDIEPGLLGLDNVVIVPHIASATIETRTNMGLIAAGNILKVLNGQMPDTCVNPEVLKK